MPASSISIVKIETRLDIETNLLHLCLKTAIPMQPESSISHSEGSDRVPQSDTNQEVFAGPSNRTQEPAQTTKPPDASRSSEAEEGSQGPGAAKEAKDVVFTSVRRRKGQSQLDTSTSVNEKKGESRAQAVLVCWILTRSASCGRLRGGGDSNQELPLRPPPTPRLEKKSLTLVRLEELNNETSMNPSFSDLDGIELIEDTSCKHLTRSSLRH
jgi:hypothetical protein